MLARAIVSGASLREEQRARFQHVTLKFDVLHTRWRVAWERKCQRSFRVRLTMWRNYLEEYRERPAENADRYAYEVRKRVMLHFLQQGSSSLDEAEIGLLTALDTVLRQDLMPGSIIWGDEFAASFTKSEYWYLYGALPRVKG